MATKNHNRPRKPIRTLEMDVGQEGIAQISLSGAASIERSDIEIVDGPDALKHAEELAFMEEEVVINIHETDDPNAEPYVQVGSNGKIIYITRGEDVIIKRKYLERLARAKRVGYQQKHLNSSDPLKYNRLDMKTALQYPFELKEDLNPRGRDWLVKILKEAA
ncbi:MAG: hypothetical protein HY749_16325 [Gammaproteobacteria bacterium]|nr:hypothetical protein [Gammaproteobacteria bacterium]